MTVESGAVRLQIIILLLLSFLAASDLDCDYTGVNITGGGTVASTCVDVTFINVSITSGIVTVDIQAMVESMQSMMPSSMLLSFQNCRLASKGSIAFIGYNSSLANTTVFPEITIDIAGLNASDGALAFVGAFPKQTTISISNSTMTASNNGQNFSSLGLVDAYAVQIALVDVILYHSSNFILSMSNFFTTAPASLTQSLVVTGAFALFDSSYLGIEDCNFSSARPLVLSSATVTIQYSHMTISSTSFVSDINTAAILLWKSTFTLNGSSHVLLSNCTILNAVGPGLSISQTRLVLDTKSTFSIEGTSTITGGLDAGLSIVRGSTLNFLGGSACLISSLVILGSTAILLSDSHVGLSGAGSKVLFTSAVFSGLSGTAVDVSSSLINISNGASVKLDQSTVSGLISFSQSPLIIDRSSSLVIASCIITGSSGCLSFTSSPINVSGFSTFEIVSSTLTSSSKSALFLQMSPATISGQNSTWLIQSSTLTSSGTSSDALSISSSSNVLLQSGGSWQLENSTFVAANSKSSLSFSSSNVHLMNEGVWLIIGCTLISTGQPILLYQLTAELSSWFGLMNNTMVVFDDPDAEPSCVSTNQFSSPIVLQRDSYVSFLNNNCSSATGGGSISLFDSGVVDATNGSAFYERCNTLNGVPSSVQGLPTPFVSVAIDRSSCASSCKTTVDCFAPNVNPTVDTCSPSACSCGSALRSNAANPLCVLRSGPPTALPSSPAPTVDPTTASPETVVPSTVMQTTPTTVVTAVPRTTPATTSEPTTATLLSTALPTTPVQTTLAPKARTTAIPTTSVPTALTPTEVPTTSTRTTQAPSTVASATPTSVPPAGASPTSVPTTALPMTPMPTVATSIPTAAAATRAPTSAPTLPVRVATTTQRASTTRTLNTADHTLSDGASQSETPSMPLQETASLTAQLPAPDELAALVGSATAAAVKTAVATSVATAMVAGPGGASDVQGVAIMSISSCSRPSNAARRGDYLLLSPFALHDSPSGLIAGNSIPLGAVLILQAVGYVYVRFARREHHLRACAVIRFPAIPLLYFASVHQSLTFASLKIFTGYPESSLPGEVVVAFLVLLLAICLPLALLLGAWHIPRRFVLYDFSDPASPFCNHPVLRALVPVGLTLPHHARLMGSSLLAGYRTPSGVCVLTPFVSSFVINLVGLISPSAPSWFCRLGTACSGLVHLALAVAVVTHRIHRWRVSGLFMAAGLLVLVAYHVQILSQDGSSVASVVLTMQLVLSCIRCVAGVVGQVAETYAKNQSTTRYCDGVVWWVGNGGKDYDDRSGKSESLELACTVCDAVSHTSPQRYRPYALPSPSANQPAYLPAPSVKDVISPDSRSSPAERQRIEPLVLTHPPVQSLELPGRESSAVERAESRRACEVTLARLRRRQLELLSACALMLCGSCVEHLVGSHEAPLLVAQGRRHVPQDKRLAMIVEAASLSGHIRDVYHHHPLDAAK